MKYEHISQKPYCCVPACVQMILRRRKLQLLPQTEIAYDLGIMLPPKERHLFKSYKGSKPKSGWGTRIDVKKYSLTFFFQKRGYNLKEKFFPGKGFSSEKSFKDFLSKNVKNDLLVCFNHPLLYKGRGSKGHASLIQAFTGEYIILSDPDSGHKKPRKVPVANLLKAIKGHYKGGVWVVK
jgi:hypothetical protein